MVGGIDNTKANVDPQKTYHHLDRHRVNTKDDNKTAASKEEKRKQHKADPIDPRLKLLVETQRSLMKDIISLNDQTKIVEHSGNHDPTQQTATTIQTINLDEKAWDAGKSAVGKEENNQFKLVRHKKFKKEKVATGENLSEDSLFKGTANGKKIWIFVSRVDDKVTEEIVQDHIIKNLHQPSKKSELHVQEVLTRDPRKDNKCFLVGVPTQFKETVYENKF